MIVEIYVGYSDQTWNVFEVEVPELTNDIEYDAIQVLRKQLDKSNIEVSFMGIYSKRYP